MIRVSLPYSAIIYCLQYLYNANSLLFTTCGTSVKEGVIILVQKILNLADLIFVPDFGQFW